MRSTHFLRDIVPGHILPWRLLDGLSDGFIETDSDGGILHANTAAAQLLAGRGSALSGISLAEYVHADSREAFLPLLISPHLPEHPREAVVRLLSSDAGPVNALLSVEMEHDDEEMRLWWIIRPAADTDFTRRRLALQAEVSKVFNGMWLDPKELMMIVARSAAELIGDLCVIRIISHDRKTLHPMAIHHCNPEALEIVLGVNAIPAQPFGSGPAEIILRTGKSLLIPRVDSRELYSNIGKEFQVYLDAIGVDSLLMVPLRANGEIIGTIGMSRDRGGIPYTVEDQVLLEDLADRAGMAADNVRLHGTVRDELAERSLAEHRYRIVTQATSDVVWDWDLIRGTIWRNSSLTDLLGYKPEELSEFDWWTQWIHPDDRASVVAGLEDAVARAARTWTSEYRFMRKDGTYAYISDRGCVEAGSDGRAVRMMGAMADVSASREAAALLEASERKYRSLVENIPDVLWTTDAEGRISYISPNVERLLGITAQQVIESGGMELRERIHPDDLAVAWEACRALFEENRPYRCECRMRHADGEWRWIRKHATSTYQVDGHRYADGTFSDITGLKRAEEELKIFRSLMDQSNDSIFVIDPEHGRFIDVNDVCCVRLGYTRAEMLEMMADDIETTMAVNLTWEQRMRSIRSLGSLTLDGVQRRRDGTTYPVDVNVKLIVVGDREFVVAVARDITERKRVEEELKIFRSLMEQSNDSLFVIDPVSGKMLDVNEVAHAHLGYTREQLLSLTIIDIENLFPDLEAWNRAVETKMRPIGSVIVEGSHRRRDGSSYPVELSVKLISLEDHEFLVAVGRDITERKRTEESLRQAHDLLVKRIDERTAEVMEMMERFERARDSQAQFVADASHDLMTPLTVMRAEVDLLLQDSGLDGGTRQALDRVHEESQRLDRLASDLLLLATLETIGSELVTHPVSLTDMVMECVTEVEGVVAKRVILNLDLEDVPEIQSVPPMLNRALVSVIDNAAKYSPEGGTVRIRVFTTEQTVLIEVADQGPGIQPEDLPRVFDRFYRGDRSRSTQGTGLGLPIVKAVMKLHKGDVVIDSSNETGTLVRLVFPLREIQATE